MNKGFNLNIFDRKLENIYKKKRIIYKMPRYHITKYTFKQAKKLGVRVVPSTNKTKKIDVYKLSNNKKIASVGANGMNDFPTFMAKMGPKYAKTRRRLYKMRHEKDRHIKWSNGWLADKLLW
jgi:hypothetical protein